MNEFGLRPDEISKIRSVFQTNEHISRVVIYGSRAKGTYKNGSDIDLCLEGDQLAFDDLQRIEQQLDELDLPYKFDVSIKYRINSPDIIEHIERVGQVFYVRRR